MEHKKKKEGIYQSLASKCSSSLLSVIGTGISAIILGIAFIYLLHPYLAILGLILASSFLVRVSDAAAKYWEKTVAATFAVAVFLMMFALPSGELGTSKCPDRTIPGFGSSTTVKYFNSPFCTSCIIFERNVEDAQKQAGFTLQFYDSRYCKAEMAHYGFPGTPCYAFVHRDGSTSRACGVLSTEEIVELAQEVG